MVEEKRAIIDKVKSGKAKGQFKFVLKALNGEVIAKSHPESYKRIQGAIKTIENHFKGFVIYEKTATGLKRLGNIPNQEERAY